MTRIVIQLDSAALSNPDLDIRYQLPDLLAQRSAGVIADDGYDYADDPRYLLLFLTTKDIGTAIACILEVIENVRVLENDLRRATVVAVKRKQGYEVVYPGEYQGHFAVPQRDE